MIKGLFQHMYLFLTFQHPGTGLKTGWNMSVFLFTLYLLSELVRWQILGGVELGLFFYATTIIFYSFIYVLWGNEKANAYSIIFLAFDLLSMFFWFVWDSRVAFFLLLWKLIALFMAFSRMTRQNIRKD